MCFHNHTIRLLFLKAFRFIGYKTFMKREKAIELYNLKIWKFCLQVEDGWLSIHISFSPHHKSLWNLCWSNAITPHSSTLAWKIPWMEEPGRLQSMGSRRVRHDKWLHFHFSLSRNGEGNGNPLQCSCLENPRDGGAWWAAVYGVAQSQTRLKQLSSSNAI